MKTKHLTCKIALKPTIKQEEIFKQWAGASRFIYNWGLALRKQLYEEGKYKIDVYELNKYLNILKDSEKEYSWLNLIPSETRKQALKDMDTAYKRFFTISDSGFPKFKSKRKTPMAFYVRYDAIKIIDERHIKIPSSKDIEGDMIVKTYEKVNIPTGKILNSRIKYDGKYWYLTFVIRICKENIGNSVIDRFVRNKSQIINTPLSDALGIDLGILHTMTLSNGKTYENINKDYEDISKTQEEKVLTNETIRLRKKLKRLQRKLNKKYKMHKQGNKHVKTNNIKKLEQQIRLVNRRIKNIRNTHISQMTTEIVKTKPSKVVMETLDVSNMLKNRKLAKSIQDQSFYEIRRQMEYKCDIYGILFKLVDKLFPSSKLCSKCGYKNASLTLKDRQYNCPQCGLSIDRDLNAAINLSMQ